MAGDSSSGGLSPSGGLCGPPGPGTLKLSMADPNSRERFSAVEVVLLSLRSFLLATSLFSAAWCFLLAPQDLLRLKFDRFLWVLFMTLVFGLPVWCVYLPVIVAIRHATARNFWFIFVSGILIGPASLSLWLQYINRNNRNWKGLWEADPVAGWWASAGFFLVCSAIVGFLSAIFYVFSLRRGPRRRAPQGRIRRGAI